MLALMGGAQWPRLSLGRFSLQNSDLKLSACSGGSFQVPRNALWSESSAEVLPGPSTQLKVMLGPVEARPVKGHRAGKFDAACAEACASHLPRQDSEVVGLVSSNRVDEVHDAAKRHPQRRIINKKGGPSRWDGNQPADPMAILVAVVAHIEKFVIVILIAVKNC
jgi:hypothetical protein